MANNNPISRRAAHRLNALHMDMPGSDANTLMKYGQ
jgi:hypothetical protein